MKHILSDLGEIKIHKNLIRQIVEIAALTVDCVANLAITTERWLSKILSLLKLSGIKIDLSKDVRIEVPIVVKYGYNIPEVAIKVQEEILKSLSRGLNIDSAYIIIKVKGLEK